MPQIQESKLGLLKKGDKRSFRNLNNLSLVNLQDAHALRDWHTTSSVYTKLSFETCNLKKIFSDHGIREESVLTLPPTQKMVQMQVRDTSLATYIGKIQWRSCYKTKNHW